MTTSIPRRQRARPPEPRPIDPQRAEPRQTEFQETAHPESSPRAVGARSAVIAVRRLFEAQTGNYFLVLGTTLFLLVFGLVMVLSSSTISSYNDTEDFFSGFVRQWLFSVVGVPLMLIASRMRPAFWKRWAGVAMLIGIALQLVVLAVGEDINGNRNWLSFGSFSLQPSEITKVALAIWLALILSRKLDRLHRLREVVIPIVPVAGAATAFVLMGGDLGTAIIIVAIVFGALFFAGVRLWILAIPVAVLAVAGPLIANSSDSRRNRVSAFLDGCASQADQASVCWQTMHGWWALASGRVFGVGLGGSKAKWSWLPEADNDFIFAIIGEELGLLGAITVLVLFIVLAVGFVRIIRASTDPFARITVSAVMIWIVGQAFVNIAVVLGLLPVLGVPLPLISAGGSALVTSLFAIGIVLSFAREPVARSQTGGRVDREPGSRPSAGPRDLPRRTGG